MPRVTAEDMVIFSLDRASLGCPEPQIPEGSAKFHQNCGELKNRVLIWGGYTVKHFTTSKKGDTHEMFLRRTLLEEKGSLRGPEVTEGGLALTDLSSLEARVAIRPL
jgi:hypothetical protein